jgi:anti-sigma regulatory factor (Ser/Thr protein kinase)
MSFPHAASGVTEARHFLTGQLTSWGLDPLRPELELAVSELLTNAVTHGSGRVELEVRCEDGAVHAEVSDEGGGRPAVRARQADDEPGGWGLRLVDRVADDWGTSVAPGRTTVWLRLAVPRPQVA